MEDSRPPLTSASLVGHQLRSCEFGYAFVSLLFDRAGSADLRLDTNCMVLDADKILDEDEALKSLSAAVALVLEQEVAAFESIVPGAHWRLKFTNGSLHIRAAQPANDVLWILKDTASGEWTHDDNG